jgi:hypothetical protein
MLRIGHTWLFFGFGQVHVALGSNKAGERISIPEK